MAVIGTHIPLSEELLKWNKQLRESRTQSLPKTDKRTSDLLENTNTIEIKHYHE